RRNTPASAGRTTPHVAPPARSSEHPRVGGEDVRRRYTMSPEVGTPPRRRGGQRRHRPRLLGRRNTPASAGRTRWCAAVRCGPADHPRVVGADRCVPPGPRAEVGAPPRRRGGRDPLSRAARGRRNTPASAGRTTAPPPRTSPTAEHPRVGGEDVGDLPFEAADDGTPPRRRGGPRHPHRAHLQRRNTPASAGRTATGRKSPLSLAEHPRVGGEDAENVWW